jgi:hypothetical protein
VFAGEKIGDPLAAELRCGQSGKALRSRVDGHDLPVTTAEDEKAVARLVECQASDGVK